MRNFKVTFSGSRKHPYQSTYLTMFGKEKYSPTPRLVQWVMKFIDDVKHRNDWNVDVDPDGIMRMSDKKTGMFLYIIQALYWCAVEKFCKHDFEETDHDIENGYFQQTCSRCGKTVSGFMC